MRSLESFDGSNLKIADLMAHTDFRRMQARSPPGRDGPGCPISLKMSLVLSMRLLTIRVQLDCRYSLIESNRLILRIEDGCDEESC